MPEREPYWPFASPLNTDQIAQDAKSKLESGQTLPAAIADALFRRFYDSNIALPRNFIPRTRAELEILNDGHNFLDSYAIALMQVEKEESTQNAVDVLRSYIWQTFTEINSRPENWASLYRTRDRHITSVDDLLSPANCFAFGEDHRGRILALIDFQKLIEYL